MRHLVVCCDGTWNSAEQSDAGVPTPTNVRIFHNALAPTDRHGHPQVSRYFSGVGADGSLVTRALDGGTGRGLSHNIMNAYLWLAATFRTDDRITVIGFSRGAYTARSLVGMLCCCGLLAFHGDEESGERWEAVRRVFTRGYVPADPDRIRDETFHPGFGPGWGAGTGQGERIEFVGVWDTVGALGIPDAAGVLEVFDGDDRHEFHQTQLGDEVGVARHAMALDERRGPFVPTLWTDEAQQPLPNCDRVRQLWFPGVHSDVGGGYRETGLSDGALSWMIGEAESTVGLRFRPALAALRPDPLCVLHDSGRGLWERLTSSPRAVPPVDRDPAVHPSARRRAQVSPIRQDPYRPTTVLEVRQSCEVEVLARSPWFETGLYLEPGLYHFCAEGEWIDADVAAGPDGVHHRPWSAAGLAYAAAELWGEAETTFRRWRHRPGAEFIGTKRCEDARWMELIGVVANGAARRPSPGTVDTPAGDPPTTVGATVGSPDGHQYIRIGRAADAVRVHAPGYLYAFANDAWGMYGNNRGSVRLTVRRD